MKWNECSRVLYLQNTTGFASALKLALLAIPFTFSTLSNIGVLFGAGNAHRIFLKAVNIFILNTDI